jgi:hypothetical protein
MLALRHPFVFMAGNLAQFPSRLLINLACAFEAGEAAV